MWASRRAWFSLVQRWPLSVNVSLKDSTKDQRRPRMNSTTSPTVRGNLDTTVFSITSLLSRLASLTDSRSTKGLRYPLTPLLLLVILAKLSDEDQFCGIADWIENRGQLLREAFALSLATNGAEPTPVTPIPTCRHIPSSSAITAPTPAMGKSIASLLRNFTYAPRLLPTAAGTITSVNNSSACSTVGFCPSSTKKSSSANVRSPRVLTNRTFAPNASKAAAISPLYNA